jgi:hypothetical protein
VRNRDIEIKLRVAHYRTAERCARDGDKTANTFVRLNRTCAVLSDARSGAQSKNYVRGRTQVTLIVAAALLHCWTGASSAVRIKFHKVHKILVFSSWVALPHDQLAPAREP